MTSVLSAALTSASLAAHPQATLLSLTLDPPSFHFPTAPGSSFHCVGDFACQPHVMGGARGGVWYAEKVLVEFGWEAQVTARWEGEGEHIGWAFALQNDSLASVGERGGGEGSLHVGLANALIIEVTEYATKGGRRERVAVYHFPHPPANAVGPPPTCVRAVTGTWRLFDGEAHRVTCGYAVGGEGVGGEVTVSVDGEAVMSVPVKLHGVLHLDMGRAWVGLLCRGGGGGVKVSEWGWAEKLPSTQPLLAWRDLRLSYRVTGPLSLILRPASLTQYTSLFRFLFDLTRCLHHLQGSWQAMGALRGSAPLPTPLPALLAVRQSLHWFVSTVRHHLYQAVIQPGLEALVKKVGEGGVGGGDFMKVRRAHDAHLQVMIGGCWVRDRIVQGVMRDIMGVAERVGGAVQEGRRVEAEWVREQREEWERLAGLLFTVWTRKVNVVGNPTLSHLLTSLDFNHHLSRIAIHAGIHRME